MFNINMVELKEKPIITSEAREQMREFKQRVIEISKDPKILEEGDNLHDRIGIVPASAGEELYSRQ